MRRLALPTNNALEVFTTCAERVQNTREKRSRLYSVQSEVEKAAVDYIEKARETRLHEIEPAECVGGKVSRDEMVSLYRVHMARSEGVARGVYDRLLAAPPHRTCPLCGQRKVSTLDHHLPESKFPIFAVCPQNLVPACKDCNTEKASYVPNSAEAQMIHPYFDDFENDRWIYAEVVRGDNLTFRFFVRGPDCWSDTKKKRALKHFTKLNLEKLYISYAVEEICYIRHRLSNLYQVGGEQAIRSHLHEEFLSKSQAHLNSWQTATYDCLVQDDWFCDGGFRLA